MPSHKPLRVLVACERSGVVRRAFCEAGHDAWSCDLVDQDDYDPKNPHTHNHYRSDIFSVLNDSIIGARKWDLLIGHPPCTYLCNSGVRWLAPGGSLDMARYEQMQDGANFFGRLYNCGIPRIAIENPVMHGRAEEHLASFWRVPDFSQSVQPWQFGTDESGPDNAKKRTCWWLKGLPILRPTGTLDGSTARPDVHHASPSPDRARIRSTFFPGMAKAMAEQWGLHP